ncbi:MULTISPECIES: site-specific integrase [Clostridium]|uniref:site-specific integrase n=1 Tax=Clostridium TaxID=1485 RepID=UPI0008266F79|nr:MULTISPECIES: site-specific integrase [Clostridium]PJI06552.1 hypothetical protein CUB90_01140 [Clostridium sp. CT7]
MNWEEIYNQWMVQRIDDKPIISERLIKKFRKINEHNRNLYLEYHNHFFKNNKLKLSSYRNYRSKIVDFLTYRPIINKKLEDITQENIDDYFYKFIDRDKATSFNNRVSYIKDFFDFHKSKLKIKLEFKIRSTKNEIDNDKDNQAVALRSDQIEFYRQQYYTQPAKLFLFEMVYYDIMNLNELKMLKKYSFDKENREIILKNKKIKIPSHLISLAERLQKGFNVDELIKEIKKELREKNMVENFKYIDITKTRDFAFITCPECGKKYEAIAENWCVKQYYNGGNHWIVCRKCGDLDERK